MAQSAHIRTAQAKGMKAGMRALEQSLVEGTLPNLADLAVEYFSIPKNGRFAWYCERYGEQVKAKPRTRTPRTQAEPVGVQVEAAPKNESEVERLERELKEAKARAKAQANEPKQATRISGKMASALDYVAYKRGKSFEISVKYDGKTLTPAQASAIIQRGFDEGILKTKGSK